jgi:hypothetical protein
MNHPVLELVSSAVSERASTFWPPPDGVGLLDASDGFYARRELDDVLGDRLSTPSFHDRRAGFLALAASTSDVLADGARDRRSSRT